MLVDDRAKGKGRRWKDCVDNSGMTRPRPVSFARPTCLHLWLHAHLGKLHAPPTLQRLRLRVMVAC